MIILLLAFRNVLLQWKRYMLMFLAILIGFALVILIHSLTFGVMETVNDKAARYFSGHISITGYKRRAQVLDNPRELIEKLKASSLPISTISMRTVYYRKDASLYYNGETVNQRRLVGIDFTQEYAELSHMQFTYGSIDKLLEEKDGNGILISEVAASLLGARVGDAVTLNMTTDTGQFNTATLIVRGIFRETSLFGYVAYMNRSDLNSLMQKDPGFTTDIAVYEKKGVNTEDLLSRIHSLLGKTYMILSPIEVKEDLPVRLAEVKDGKQRLAILTLDIHLSQIKTIMDAVKIVTWVIEVLFMLIIMVGILNTYRVLVFERTKEIGTLRAMGMTRPEVRFLFLFEAFFLDLAACIAGFILFSVIVKILERVDISLVPGAGLFTERGRLIPHLDPAALAYTFLLMLAAVLIAAWRPAGKASKLSPVDAMREEN